MSDHRSDERLRESFARLSRTIEALVPEPERFIEQTARRRVRAFKIGRRLAVASLAAGLTVAALWTTWHANQPPLGRRDEHHRSAALDPVRFGDGLWRAPTDFLLDVPGAELLRSIPALGLELSTPSANGPTSTLELPSARRFTT